MRLETILETATRVRHVARSHYERAYAAHPHITNYLTTAIGTVGGDVIAKTGLHGRFTARDLAVTGIASAAYSAIATPLLRFAKATARAMAEHTAALRGTTREALVASGTLNASYQVVNALYWPALARTNGAAHPLDPHSAGTGALTLAIGAALYFAADYFMLTRLDSEAQRRAIRPIYTALSLVYNTAFAASNLAASRR